MTKNDRKKPEKQTDDLRDPIITAFRKCKISNINKTTINEYAVRYITLYVGIPEFSRFIEDQRGQDEQTDIEQAYITAGGSPIVNDPDSENDLDSEIDSNSDVDVDSENEIN